MSIVCLGPQAPNEDLECVDVKKESVRQAAAGVFMYICIHVCMYVWYSSSAMSQGLASYEGALAITLQVTLRVHTSCNYAN